MTVVHKAITRFNAYRASKTFLGAAVTVAISTDIFLYGVIVPILPFALTSRVGVAPEDVQSTVANLLTVYGAALFPGSLLFGWAVDQTQSRRGVLLLGLVLIFGATVLLAMGRTLWLLMVGRVLQGLAAAIVWSAGLSLLLDTFGHEQIGEVMGYLMIGQTFALVCAPEVGGIVFARAGYMAVFGLCLGLVGFDIVLRLLIIEQPRTQNVQSEDQTAEEADGNVSRELIVNAGILSQPVLEPHLEENTPLLPREEQRFDSAGSWWAFVVMLSSPRVVANLFCVASVGAIWTTIDTVLPNFVKEFFGWDSLGAGLIFLPVVLPAFGAAFSGKLANIYGERLVSAIPLAVGVPTFACFIFVQGDSKGYVVLLCVLLFFAGLVMQLVIPPVTADMTHAIGELEKTNQDSFGSRGAYGRGYGIYNCAFAAGVLLGPAVAGAVLRRDAWWLLPVLLSALSLVNAVLTICFVGGNGSKSKEKNYEARHEVI